MALTAHIGSCPRDPYLVWYLLSLDQKAKTHALAGSLSTLSFSKTFDISAFRNPPKANPLDYNLDYNIEIDIDMLSEDNQNFYFNIEIDAEILEGMEKVLVCGKEIKLPFKKYVFIDSNCTRGQKKCVSCPWRSNGKTDKYFVTFRRFHINEDDINEMKVYNRIMTGMKVSLVVLCYNYLSKFRRNQPHTCLSYIMFHVLTTIISDSSRVTLSLSISIYLYLSNFSSIIPQSNFPFINFYLFYEAKKIVANVKKTKYNLRLRLYVFQIVKKYGKFHIFF